MEDPFFVVRDEVEKSLAHLQELYSALKKLQSSGTQKDQLKWTADEIKTSVKTIEWDIQDLEETIRIAERNPQKFKLDASELQRRRAFVERSKQTIQEILRAASSVTAPTATNTSPSGSKSYAAAAAGAGASSQYNNYDNDQDDYRDSVIRDEGQHQMKIMDQQDTKMDAILGTVSNMKNIAITMGNELDDQAVLLDRLDNKADQASTRLGAASKRLQKFYNDNLNDRTGTCIIILSVIVILLLIMVIAL